MTAVPTADDASATVRERFAADRYAAHLGIVLLQADPERVVVAMRITPDHENFHGVTHGGAVFSVADCALSLASNATANAVAIDTHLVLTAPSRSGDTLTATAEPVTRGRTIATYRITVTRGDGRTCGLFTGTVAVTPPGSPTAPDTATP